MAKTVQREAGRAGWIVLAAIAAGIVAGNLPSSRNPGSVFVPEDDVGSAPREEGGAARLAIGAPIARLAPAVSVGPPAAKARPGEFTIERPIAVEGHVRTADGQVPAGTTLRGYVVARCDLEGVTLDGLRAQGKAVGISKGPNGIAYKETTEAIPVGADGSFRFSADRAGRIRLVAEASGAAPARWDLDAVEEAPRGAVLELRPTTNDRRIAVRDDAGPLSGLALVVSDITDDPMQSSVSVRLDGHGTMPDGYLERGRRYWVLGRRPPPSRGSRAGARSRAVFVWDGESEILLESLPAAPATAAEK